MEPKQTKSDRTRAAILAAARALFAAQGYERTTVREIAARAEIDPALVVRYFGGKEGLFAHAADFDLDLPPLAAIAPGQRGRALVAHFLKVWEGDGAGLPVLLRSAASNPAAAQRLNAIFAGQVAPALARVAGGRGRGRGWSRANCSGWRSAATCSAAAGCGAVARADRARGGSTIQRYLVG